MITLVAFGHHVDGSVWQENRYHFDTVLDAVETGEDVSRVEGFYVLETHYDSEYNSDVTTVLYEESTENMSLQVSPVFRVRDCKPLQYV